MIIISYQKRKSLKDTLQDVFLCVRKKYIYRERGRGGGGGGGAGRGGGGGQKRERLIEICVLGGSICKQV